MSGLSLICRHGSSLLAKRLIQKPDYRTFHHASFLLKDFTVIVPHMTESISEGTVSQLPKPVGSPVAVDEIVAVLETDKVSTPYVSPILVKKGSSFHICMPIERLYIYAPSGKVPSCFFSFNLLNVGNV
jgi:Biotin-requiring enzyme